MMMKKQYPKKNDSNSSTIVIPPRLSLGGKQTSWSSGFEGKRMSATNSNGDQVLTPPLHPHHLSAALDASSVSASSSSRNVFGTLWGSSGNLVTNNTTSATGSNGRLSTSMLANAQDVLMSGTLIKRGHFFKNWLPRHFVLTRTALTYYRKNPAMVMTVDDKDPSVIERRLKRGEIFRADVLRVEPTDMFKNRPYSFYVVVRKRSRRASGLSCMFVHHKESRLKSRKTSDEEAVVIYYMQASKEADRERWVKALQRWIEGEHPTKLGRAIFDFIVNNEYNSYKYEQKVGEVTDPWNNGLSPAAQAGRKVEEEHPVLATLIRDLMECSQEDEMIFILDQLLGEVNHGASSGNIKKLIAAAGEVKLETAPTVWTTHVRAAYAKIMKALYSQSQTSVVPTQPRLALGPSSTLKPTLLAPSRQTSDGGENAPEYSFHRSYKLGRKLGSGAYSVVHIATNRSTRKQVAVKCIAKSSMLDSDVDSLKHEVEIMSTLSHPNLVPLLDFYEEERYYYIVTPLCTGGELFDELVKRKTYTEEDARVLLRKLASAIEYIHSRGIVHRDLKPENILLKTSAPGAEVMIADFGFARTVKGEKRWTACGTPGYVAPEVVRGESYGAEVDCWSLGVILYILLCGYPPFSGENHVAIFEKVLAAKYKFSSPDWDLVSESAKDLVRQLLTVDRSKRLTAAGILKHPWMNPSSTAIIDDETIGRLRRVNSDLLPALNQMRKHSLTHDMPKIRPSDMQVDALELTQVSTNDVELLERELADLDGF